jgi:rubrerythrin
MDSEHEKTIEAVRFSIQMEIEGKEYYEEAAEKSQSNAGRELFGWLAAEEEKHRNRFEQIYEEIREKKAWPRIKFEANFKARAKNAFLKGISAGMSDSQGEIELAERAMALEEKTYQYYHERQAKAQHKAEKNFYEAVAAEEKGHYLTLVRYREYVLDPASFFIEEEKPGLDGA